MNKVVKSFVPHAVRFSLNGSELQLAVDMLPSYTYYTSFSNDFTLFVKENKRRNICFVKTLIQSPKHTTLHITGDGHFQGILLLQKGILEGKLNGEKILWETFHFGLFALSKFDLEVVVKANTDYVFLFINYDPSCFRKFEKGCHPYFKEFVKSVAGGTNYCVYPWFLPADLAMILLSNDVYRPSNRPKEDNYYEIKGLEILEIALRPLYSGGISKFENCSASSSRKVVNEFVDWVLEDDGYSSTIKLFTRRNRVSPSQFLAEFRRAFDITPVEFITTVRMKRVEELIAFRQFDINLIAKRVGYSSKRTLKDAYVRFYGIPLPLAT